MWQGCAWWPPPATAGWTAVITTVPPDNPTMTTGGHGRQPAPTLAIGERRDVNIDRDMPTRAAAADPGSVLVAGTAAAAGKSTLTAGACPSPAPHGVSGE